MTNFVTRRVNIECGLNTMFGRDEEGNNMPLPYEQRKQCFGKWFLRQTNLVSSGDVVCSPEVSCSNRHTLW